jgi:hypothetical protein
MILLMLSVVLFDMRVIYEVFKCDELIFFFAVLCYHWLMWMLNL